jgi:predicted PilT family ATPase
MTSISAHGVDVTSDKMVIANDSNGQQVKDIADSENINISVYKFTSKEEVAHQLEHMLNNSNKYILVVSYQDTAQEFLKSHPEVSDRLIILEQYDENSLSENMKKVADSQNNQESNFNILIISAMVILIVLMIGAILLLKNKK